MDKFISYATAFKSTYFFFENYYHSKQVDYFDLEDEPYDIVDILSSMDWRRFVNNNPDIITLVVSSIWSDWIEAIKKVNQISLNKELTYSEAFLAMFYFIHEKNSVEDFSGPYIDSLVLFLKEALLCDDQINENSEAYKIWKTTIQSTQDYELRESIRAVPFYKKILYFIGFK